MVVENVPPEVVEMLGWTPAEYFPYLLLIGFVIGAIITGIVGISKYAAGKKEFARKGELLSYGFNYLTQNVATVVFCGVVGAIGPGLYYEIVQGEPTFGGCIGMAIVISLVFGLLGEVGLRSFLEARRDLAKADEALSTSASAGSETSDDSKTE